MEIDIAHGQNKADWNQSDIWKKIYYDDKRSAWISDLLTWKVGSGWHLEPVAEPIMPHKSVPISSYWPVFFSLCACTNIQVDLKLNSRDIGQWVETDGFTRKNQK